MWICFKTNYDKTVKANIPTKILKKKITHPWISVEIKKMMKKRDRKYRHMLKNRSKVLEDEVRTLKKEIRKMTRRAHWDYIHSLFVKKDDEAPSGGMKRFWSYIKKNNGSQPWVYPPKGQWDSHHRSKMQGRNP